MNSLYKPDGNRDRNKLLGFRPVMHESRLCSLSRSLYIYTRLFITLLLPLFLSSRVREIASRENRI